MKITAVGILLGSIMSLAFLRQGSNCPVSCPTKLPEVLTTYIIVPKASYPPGEDAEDPQRTQQRHQQLQRIGYGLLTEGYGCILGPENVDLGHELYLVVKTNSPQLIEELKKDPDVSRVIKQR